MAAIPPLNARGDKHKAAALVNYILSGRPPHREAVEHARKRQGRPAGEQLQNLWALDNVIGVIAADRPATRKALAAALIDFLDLAERTHWSQWESGGYRRYQFLAWRAALRWADEHGERPLADKAGAYLKRDLTIGALCANGHGRVAMPCGRVQIGVSDGWTAKGDIDVDHDARVRALLGFDDRWWPPNGVGPSFMKENRDWLAALPSLVRPLFSAAEREALAAWARHGRALPALADLVAPIRLPQRLFVRRGPTAHAAWVEEMRSDGDRTGQVLAMSIKRRDGHFDAVGRKADLCEYRFAIGPPPCGATVGGDGWRVDHSGGRHTVAAPPGFAFAHEVAIDGTGGRLVGEPAGPPGKRRARAPAILEPLEL